MSLRDTAAQLVKGHISLTDAVEETRDAILGKHVTSSGISGRVLRSTSVVQQDIAGLAAYVGGYSIGDPEKWAGTFLMLHVQLTIEDIAAAVRMTKSVVQVSRGTCPKSAKPFALAIVDTVLAHSAHLMPPEIDMLRQARQSFARV